MNKKNPLYSINKHILPTQLCLLLLATPCFVQAQVGENYPLSLANIYRGNIENSSSGHRVAIVGDTNANGIADFLISAPMATRDETSYSPQAGRTWLIPGQSSQWPRTRTLGIGPDQAMFIGEEPFDFSGASIAGVGDVNGDGFDDFMIGAYGGKPLFPTNAPTPSTIPPIWGLEGMPRAGRAYLVFGQSYGLAGSKLKLADLANSFVGEVDGIGAGYSASGAGDVNNDGYADFLIGAPFAGLDGEYPGKTYLMFGRENAHWGKLLNLSVADVALVGEAPGGLAGFSVAGVGDVNNDGYADFLVSAPKTGPFGKVYLLLGKRFSSWGTQVNLDQANVVFQGFQENTFLGYSVTGVGDVNGNGFDDFVISDPLGGNDQRGRVYLFFGRANWHHFKCLSLADAWWEGAMPYEHAGISVSAAGDANGDGYADFLIGAAFNSAAGEHTGKTYLIYGKPNGWSRGQSLSQIKTSFVGANPGDRSGWSVSGGGDLNGNGIDDVIIGAPHAGKDIAHAGIVHVHFSWMNDHIGQGTNLNFAEAFSPFPYPQNPPGWRVLEWEQGGPMRYTGLELANGRISNERCKFQMLDSLPGQQHVLAKEFFWGLHQAVNISAWCAGRTWESSTGTMSLGVALKGNGYSWKAIGQNFVSITSADEQWQQLVLQNLIRPSGAQTFTVMLKSDRSGTSWDCQFDEVAVQNVSLVPTLTVTPTPIPVTPSPTHTILPTYRIPCPGDANKDGFVNGDDYRSVRDNFGQATCGIGDADGDCYVTGYDFRAVLDYFGLSCY